MIEVAFKCTDGWTRHRLLPHVPAAGDFMDFGDYTGTCGTAGWTYDLTDSEPYVEVAVE